MRLCPPVSPARSKGDTFTSKALEDRQNIGPILSDPPNLHRPWLANPLLQLPPFIPGANDMATNTIRLHRVLRATPDRVYRAFLDAEALAKWLPPNGFTCKVHQLEAKVGGTYRMSFTNFTTKKSHSFGGK